MMLIYFYKYDQEILEFKIMKKIYINIKKAFLILNYD
jgi:hypothetical protein